ncbi:uncharacterized protein K02A2.6-like [Ornithodoros turicata]|uniref:uncharacterized protein K02A2.6-like n=1 Tax=Ornithodoros turicata TaxID=34597 RepID=UPI0031391AAE
MDLFTYNQEKYVVKVDFYSFFFEVKKLRTTPASTIIKFCRTTFATHGLPIALITDNGPPFSGTEFNDSLTRMQVKHVYSSPYHPRSNGMAERAVRQAKQLLRKTKTEDEFSYAILEWRNTPRDSILKSPTERLMSRTARTLLPTSAKQLEPRVVPPTAVKRRLEEIRRQQKFFYDRSSKSTPDLERNSNVALYDTFSKTRAPAVVVAKPKHRDRTLYSRVKSIVLAPENTFEKREHP